jgi:hypothetical protein
MARIKKGILGGGSGSVGAVTMSSWKGIDVLKAKPTSVANPKTAGQIAQRSKFSNVVSFAGLILSTIIKPLWDRFASKQSGYNAFVQENIDLFADAFSGVLTGLTISKGKMAAPSIDSVTASNGSANVVVDFPTTLTDNFAQDTDLAYCVAINVNKEIVGVSSGVVARSVGTLTIVMPESQQTGNEFAVLLAFKRVDGTIVSNTGSSGLVV